MIRAIDMVQHAPGLRGTHDMLKLTKRIVDYENGKWKPSAVPDDDDKIIFDSLGF